MNQTPKHVRARSTAIMVASLATLPLIASAEPPAEKKEAPSKEAQKTTPPGAMESGSKFLQARRQPMMIAGVYNSQPVYATETGELFTLDGTTGDKTFLPKGAEITSAKSADGKHFTKGVVVISKDAQGHVIHQDAEGQKFYLNPKTGDKVPVK